MTYDRNPPNETKRRSIGIILTTRTPLKHPRRPIPKRRPPPASPVLLPRRDEAAILLHRLANEPRRGLLLSLWPPSRCPLRLAPRRSRRQEKHPLLHLWPGHLPRARASPGEAVSINLNHRPRHQVKPHRRPLHLRVPPQTLVPPLRLHLRLLLRLQALTVLEDGRGPCLDSRQGSSRRPTVVLATLKAETCGSPPPRRRRKGSPRRMAT